MHNNNYRKRNSTKGLFAFVFLLIGALVLVGFVTGIFRHIFWPIPLVGTIVGLLLLSAILTSARRRAHYRRVQRQQRIRYNVYQPTENPYWKNQETQVIKEKQPVQRVVSSTHFCDFCGMKISEEMSYCTNCGSKLQ